MRAMDGHRIDFSIIKDQDTLNYLMGFINFSTEKVIKLLTNNLTDTDR